MDQIYLKIIIMAIFAYFFALFLVRLTGRKIISQMTFFDFVFGVSLGTITVNVALGPNRVMAIIVLSSFVLLTILIDNLHINNYQLMKILESEPVVVIENGKIIDQNLGKVKLSISELNMQLRQKNIFNISDVEFAVIETNGKVSVLPKSQKQPLTPADLNLATGYKGLTKDLIIDGKIMSENLNDAHLDKDWLMNALHKQGIGAVADVFYAGLDTTGNLYISGKRSAQEKEGQHGIE